MLPAEHRLRTSREITATSRGRRAATRTLVVHGRRVGPGPVRIGFVVSKRVGAAVVRNRVKRRLRHLVAAELNAHLRSAGASAAASVQLVVRALPASAEASSGVLGADLEQALERLGPRLWLEEPGAQQ